MEAVAALVEEMKVGAVMAQAEGSKEDRKATGAMAEVVTAVAVVEVEEMVVVMAVAAEAQEEE